MVPFLFSSLAIRAVGEAAMAMVEEVRRQFREIPGIMEGTGKPEYEKCVAISTKASIRKMMLPGAIAISSPVIIGFVGGAEALGGFLAGATVSGVLMGLFQNNAGGAWDNAKKSFEKGVSINGVMYYKKSEPHKASVTGDTVGDPFKDTSGPSMNILIKLMSIVSLVIAPSLAMIGNHGMEQNPVGQNMQIEKSIPASEKSVLASNETKTMSNSPYAAFIAALETDGLFNEESTSIVVKNGQIQVDGHGIDQSLTGKYIPLLNGETDVDLHFNTKLE
ncbi:MAG: sodium/proton-translocating pyrophosphatase, partial [Saprospiraceae bacterium]